MSKNKDSLKQAIDDKTEMIIQAKKIIDTGYFMDQTNGQFIFADAYVANAIKSKIMDMEFISTTITSSQSDGITDTIEIPLNYPEFTEQNDDLKTQFKDKVVFGCSDFHIELLKGADTKENTENYIDNISFQISEINARDLQMKKEPIYNNIYCHKVLDNTKKVKFNMFQNDDVCSIRTALTLKKLVIKFKKLDSLKVSLNFKCYFINTKNDLLNGPLIYNFNSIVPVAYRRSYDLFKFPIKNKIPDEDSTKKYMICYNHYYFPNDDKSKDMTKVVYKRDVDANPDKKAEGYPDFKIDANHVLIKVKESLYTTDDLDTVMKGINNDVYKDSSVKDVSINKRDKEGYIVIEVKIDKITELRDYLVSKKCKVKAEAKKVELNEEDKKNMEDMKTKDVLRLYKLYTVLMA